MSGWTARQLRACLRHSGPFKVTSLANGLLTVEPAWSRERPKECTGAIVRDEHGDCVKCHMPHIGGIFSRMELAEAVQEVLNRVVAGRKGRR